MADLFDIAVAQALGGSSGGGGSSDFSIAQVTFINSGDVSTQPYYYTGIQLTEQGLITTYSNETLAVVDDSVTVPIPLYKGACTQPLQSVFSGVNADVLPTVSGGVTIDFQTRLVTITGDGTFTAAGLESGV